MSLPEPFRYPETHHQRRHGPGGYRNYQDYKPWLRDEFIFRCVYCLERERWHPDGAASFSVDHVQPRSITPMRVGDYDNLVYTCARCNTARQDVPLLDPTVSAFNEHLRIEDTGEIRALTPEGQDLIDVLHLDSHLALRVRQHIIRVLNLRRRYPDDAEVNQVYLDVFGFPNDLPALASLRPPSGNKREEGLATCFYSRRQRNELGEVH